MIGYGLHAIWQNVKNFCKKPYIENNGFYRKYFYSRTLSFIPYILLQRLRKKKARKEIATLKKSCWTKISVKSTGTL
jgi:hypothetical protein